jgi:hypothetical protein
MFLQGAAAVAVAAWSPAARSWVPSPGPGTISVPGLDGQLLVDAADLTAAADDFGHIVHRTPIAVLVPASVADIVTLVRFARQHGLQVAGARGIGQSHSTQGQSEVLGGVVIDMAALATIHEINECDALVDAGVHWIDLLTETVPLGKSPPTLTDYIDLSVGGTLSVGGIGGQAFRQGLQVDNVLELDVVTGTGELVTCSPWENTGLFEAVRAGLGQFGIIVRARVRLVPVPSMVRIYTGNYDDLGTFTGDQLELVREPRPRFDFIEGSLTQGTNNAWTYQIQVAKYFDPASPPNDAALLAGLHFLPGSETSTDVSYFDFANQLAPTVALLQEIGAWGWQHPWLNLFIPADQTVPFVQGILNNTTPTDTGSGPVLLYPVNRNQFGTPFARVPDAPQSFLFSVLRFTIPGIPGLNDQLIAANRAAYDACVALGGKRYPIDSVPMSHADWQTQLSPLFGAFAAAKALFDPGNVLTPGQGIF